MMTLSKRFMLLVMLTFMLRSPSSWAEINLQPKTCVNREMEEKFVICFEENMACHSSLRKASLPSSPDWMTISIAIGSGLLVGMFLEHRLSN